jgi:hypothetical protein
VALKFTSLVHIIVGKYCSKTECGNKPMNYGRCRKITAYKRPLCVLVCHHMPSLSLRSLSYVHCWYRLPSQQWQSCNGSCLRHLSYGARYSEFHTTSGSASPKLCLFMWPHHYSQDLCPLPLISFLQDLDKCQTLGMLHNSDLDSSSLLRKKFEFKSSVENIWSAL